MKPIGMGRDRKRPMFEHYLVATVCRAHHTEFDELGADRMRDKYGVDFWKLAAMDLAKWVFGAVDSGEMKDETQKVKK
jgi:hypothetical protein